MNQEQHIPTQRMGTSRYFVSYSGIKLPLKLVNEITEEDEVRDIHFDESGEMR